MGALSDGKEETRNPKLDIRMGRVPHDCNLSLTSHPRLGPPLKTAPEPSLSILELRNSSFPTLNAHPSTFNVPPMPTYDYKCKKCEHVWEEFHSIKAAPSKKCPACGKNAAERQISSGGAILFKGSGFYLTDYRSDNYKKGAAADASSSAPPKAEGSSTPPTTSPAKTDSQPAKGKSTDS